MFLGPETLKISPQCPSQLVVSWRVSATRRFTNKDLTRKYVHQFSPGMEPSNPRALDHDWRMYKPCTEVTRSLPPLRNAYPPMALVTNEPGDGLPLDRVAIDDRGSQCLTGWRSYSTLSLSTQGDNPYLHNSPECSTWHCFFNFFLCFRMINVFLRTRLPV